MRRVQNTSSSFAKRTSSATRRVYTSPWKKKKKTHRSYPPPHVVDFHIAFKSKPGLIELRRQDKTVDASRPRPRASEPDSSSRGHHPRAPTLGRTARARGEQRDSIPPPLPPVNRGSMAASSFGAQLALFFTFVFQVQGELVVQSDNVTFPPYADLPAMFGPPIPAGEERLLGVLKVSPF